MRLTHPNQGTIRRRRIETFAPDIINATALSARSYSESRMLHVTDYDILATIIIAALVFGIAAWQGAVMKLPPRVSVLFAASALVLSFARYRVEIFAPADAVGYYIESQLGAEFDIGTGFMPFLTSLLTMTLGLGFLPSMMFFTVFALVSMQICYAVFLRMGGGGLALPFRLLYLAAIVPPLGFWGSGIAKDAIVLLGVSLFCAGVTRTRARLPWLVAGIVLVLLIRPHIGLMMILGVAVGYFVAPNTNSRERLVILGSTAAAGALIVPLTISYLGLGSLTSVSDVSIQINSLAAGYEGTGSYVDIASLPLPLQVVSYLFRPLPWEAGSVSQAAAAGQNVLIGFIIAITIPSFIRRRRDWRSLQIATLLGYSSTALIVLAVTTANLGVASRQKWMVLVPLFIILFRGLIIDRRLSADASEGRRRRLTGPAASAALQRSAWQ